MPDQKEKRRHANGPPPESTTGVGGDNMEVLLQNVMAERNALRVQNDQLWKIIEKQRGIIHSLHAQMAANGLLPAASDQNLSLDAAVPASNHVPLGVVKDKRERATSERTTSARKEGERGRGRSMSENKESERRQNRQSWERDSILPAITIQSPTQKDSRPGSAGANHRHSRQRSHSASSQRDASGVVFPPLVGSQNAGLSERLSTSEGGVEVVSSLSVRDSSVSSASNTGIYEYQMEPLTREPSSASIYLEDAPPALEPQNQRPPSDVSGRPTSRMRKVQSFSEQIEESAHEDQSLTTAPSKKHITADMRRARLESASRPQTGRGRLQDVSEHEVVNIPARSGSSPFLPQDEEQSRRKSSEPVDLSRTNLESLPGSQPVLSTRPVTEGDFEASISRFEFESSLSRDSSSNVLEPEEPPSAPQEPVVRDRTESLPENALPTAPLITATSGGDVGVPQLSISNNSTATNTKTPNLDDSQVAIVGSTIRVNDKGKDMIAFIISVRDHRGTELWRVEKMYSSFLNLDSKLKTNQNRATVNKIGKLPDKALFQSRAPSKSDERKVALELYLQHVKGIVPENPDLQEFLSTDLIETDKRLAAKRGNATKSTRKEGYLSKKGKNFGGWKTRYFVLGDKGLLEYYESPKDKALLGAIKLKYVFVARQTATSTTTIDPDYRHAFIVTEYKKSAFHQHFPPPSLSPPNTEQFSESRILNRHILCAENDEERDEWVESLQEVISQLRMGGKGGEGLRAGMVGASESSLSSALGSRSELDEDFSRRIASPVEEENESMTGTFERGSTLGRDDIGNGSMSRNGTLNREDLNMVRESTLARDSGSSAGSTLDRRSPVSPTIQPRQGQQPYPMMGGGNGMMGGGNGLMGAPVDLNAAPLRVIKNWVDDNERVLQQPVPPPLVADDGERGRTADESGSKSRKSKRMTAAFGWAKRKAAGVEPPRLSDPGRRVFNVPLEQAVAVSKVKEGYELPAVVYRCIEYLDAKKAAEEEGIYRLSGSTSVMQNLKERFNTEGDVDLLGSNIYYDVHAIAGLLKLYLRELPAPILTRELQRDFLSITDLSDRNDRISELTRLITKLPLANYTLLRSLIAHLVRVVQQCDVNRMTARNMSIVFSPTLGVPAGIFTLMLAEYGTVFMGVGGKGEDGEGEGEGEGDSGETFAPSREVPQVVDEVQVLGNGAMFEEPVPSVVGDSSLLQPRPPREAQSASKRYRGRSASGSRSDQPVLSEPTTNPDGDTVMVDRQEEAKRVLSDGEYGDDEGGEIPVPKRRQANSAKRRARQNIRGGFMLEVGNEYDFAQAAAPGPNRNSNSYLSGAPDSVLLKEASMRDIHVLDDTADNDLEADLYSTAGSDREEAGDGHDRRRISLDQRTSFATPASNRPMSPSRQSRPFSAEPLSLSRAPRPFSPSQRPLSSQQSRPASPTRRSQSFNQFPQSRPASPSQRVHSQSRPSSPSQKRSSLSQSRPASPSRRSVTQSQQSRPASPSRPYQHSRPVSATQQTGPQSPSFSQSSPPNLPQMQQYERTSITSTTPPPTTVPMPRSSTSTPITGMRPTRVPSFSRPPTPPTDDDEVEVFVDGESDREFDDDGFDVVESSSNGAARTLSYRSSRSGYTDSDAAGLYKNEDLDGEGGENGKRYDSWGRH